VDDGGTSSPWKTLAGEEVGPVLPASQVDAGDGPGEI